MGGNACWEVHTCLVGLQNRSCAYMHVCVQVDCIDMLTFSYEVMWFIGQLLQFIVRIITVECICEFFLFCRFYFAARA